MMKTQRLLKNDRGSMLILITIMLLLLVTIISFSASRTANTEVIIAGNEYRYQKSFYRAEGAAIDSIDMLEASTNPKTADFAWLGFNTSEINDANIFTYAYWDEDGQTGSTRGQASALDPGTTSFLAVHRGVLPGSSLDMSKPTKHTFSIYGRCVERGTTMIKIGYSKAY
jgi:hypothetical protein